MAIADAYTSDSQHRGLLRLEMYEESNSISGNYSIMRIRVNVMDGNGSYGGYGPGSWSASVPGIGSWGYGFNYDFGAGQNYALLDTTFTLYHAADGSASVSASASFSGDGAPVGSASTGLALSSPSTITDFNFSAAAPTSLSASYVAGTGVVLSWPASVSYKTPVTYYLSYRSSSDGGATYGSWSGESTTTNLTYTYAGLTPGLTYQFRVRAYNGYDQYSGFTGSNTVFLTAGGKRYAAPNWALTAAQEKRWDGSAWVSLTTAKQYDATSKTWVNLS